MNPIDYVFEIQRALGASPHDTDVFHRLQLPSEFQSKGFQKLRERRRSSSVDSINKSSDFEPLSQIAQGTVYLKRRKKIIVLAFIFGLHNVAFILSTEEFTYFLYVLM